MIQKSGTICTRNSGMLHVPNVKHECFKNCLNGIPGLRALTMEQTKKQLRAVLLSSKEGVPMDRLEIEYYNLVFNLLFISIPHSVCQSCRLEKAWHCRRDFMVSPLSASSWLDLLMFAAFTGEEVLVWSVVCLAKRLNMLLGW